MSVQIKPMTRTPSFSHALTARAVDRGPICRVDLRSVGTALDEQVRAVSEGRRSNLSQLFRISESLTNKGETVFNLSLPDEKFNFIQFRPHKLCLVISSRTLTDSGGWR
jgi:hypothetical protein